MLKHEDIVMSNNMTSLSSNTELFALNRVTDVFTVLTFGGKSFRTFRNGPIIQHQ